MKKTVSLKKNCDFQEVFKNGKTKGSDILVVFVAPFNGAETENKQNRLGVTVSKKMGNAVKRNLLRRRIKEAFRTFEQELKGGHDIVILPKQGLADASFLHIKKTLKGIMRRQGLLA